MPSKFRNSAPRVVEKEDGSQVWVYDGREFPNVGFNAVVGKPTSDYSFEPTRFDQMRQGAWDVHKRIEDMNLDGTFASLNFPSFLPGFCGHRLQLGTSDPDLALAAVRAWNDWHLEEWCGSYPDRLIPCQIPYLLDPQVAADEVRRNASRGFKAISFSEGPHHLGLPSIHSGYWDPLVAACEETGTVINLHVGSSGSSPSTSPDAPPDTVGVLFFGYAMFAAVDWLFSRLPVRFPELRICLSEGGIGWVAGLIDRLDHVKPYQEIYGTWTGIDIDPADVLRRNFWFCAVDDPTSFASAGRIGKEHILIEVDYPHADSTWPNSQAQLHAAMGGITDPDEVAGYCWRNAAQLYRHPIPTAVQQDPNAFLPNQCLQERCGQ
jgi:predicted TIM-barrel fold metal-dependent hydrolase